MVRWLEEGEAWAKPVIECCKAKTARKRVLMGAAPHALAVLLVCQGSFDLAKVIQIVPCHQASHVSDALIAPLLMHAVIIPQLLGDGLQQGNVGRAQHAI